MDEIDEETEYGTETYRQLQGLRKAINECNPKTISTLNNLLKYFSEEGYGDIVQKQLNDEVSRLTVKFENNCKCIGIHS